MKPLPPDALLEALRWRYATKKFDPARRIPDATWAALEAALVLTPSSYGLQPWKFLIVTDPALRKALLPLSWNQAQVVDCSHYVVFARVRELSEADLDRFLRRTAEVRSVPEASLAPYRKMMARHLIQGPEHARIAEWAGNQAYIALGNLMTSAALLGIDACPMEGLQPDRYDEVLGLRERGLGTVVACALGYRDPSDKYAGQAKVRYPSEEVLERR